MRILCCILACVALLRSVDVLAGRVNEYVLHNYDLKEATPYEVERPRYFDHEYVPYEGPPTLYNVPGSPESVQGGGGNSTPEGITSYQAAEGERGTLTPNTQPVNLKFPYRGGTVVTSFFGWRRLGNEDKARFHNGVDLVGTKKELFASGTGVVKFSGWIGGYGNSVGIEYSAAQGIHKNAPLAQVFREFAEKTDRALNNAEAEQLRQALESAGQAAQTAQDDIGKMLIDDYVQTLKRNEVGARLTDPRSYVLVVDMMNTNKNLLGFLSKGNVPSRAGTSGEFEAVYDSLKNHSWWATESPQRNRQGYMNRIDHAYEWVKGKSFPSGLDSPELMTAIADRIKAGEGDYTSVNANDEGKFSYGYYGFRQTKAVNSLRRTAEYLEGVISQGSTQGSGIVVLFYAHLESASSLKENDEVTSDTIIGKEGNSGASQGSHLHLSGYIGAPYDRSLILRVPQLGSEVTDTNLGTTDPLAIIFGCENRSQAMDKLGVDLPISGAQGNTSARISADLVEQNATFGAAYQTWQ